MLGANSYTGKDVNLWGKFRTSASGLEYRTFLPGGFAGKGKAGFRFSFAADLRRQVFAEGGAVFESVAGAAAHKPNVGHFRMTVDQKIAVGGVFVLADAGFDDGRVFE